MIRGCLAVHKYAIYSHGPCFCHETDRSVDTKPQKLKARMMLEMVRDINAKFGDGQTHVTCWVSLSSVKFDVTPTEIHT